MRVHRLRLEHVRGIAATALTFPQTGVVVIEGPNEVGKSTLLEALDRLLDPKAKASSKAASIVSMQPVGQDVGPYVEAELEIGPYRVIFAKRWLRQPATTLQILQPAPEQLTGQDAQARMNAILDECLDRTLFDALRLTQSGSPGAIELRDSAVLEAALDAAAGAHLHAADGSALLLAVEREYQRYYTAGTGRVTGELREAQTAVTESEHLHEQAEHDVREVEELFARRERLAHDLIVSEETMRAASSCAQAADAAVAHVIELRSSEAAAVQAIAAAEQSHRRALRDVAARAGLREDDSTQTSEVSRLQEQVEHLESQQTQRARALVTREKELEHANGVYAKAQGEADAAATQLGYERAKAELEALAERISTAETITGRLEQRRMEVEGYPIDATVLDELRLRDAQLTVAQARVEAGATAVRVSAPGPGHSVEIEEESRALDPGRDVIERLISSDVSLVVDSRVRIDIRPDGQARQRVEERDALRDALAERLEELDLSDLAEAELAGARWAEAVTGVADLERELLHVGQGDALQALRDAHAARAADLATVDVARVADLDRADAERVADLDRADAARVADLATSDAVPMPAAAQRAEHLPQGQPGAAPDAGPEGGLKRAIIRAESTRCELPQANTVRAAAQQAADTARVHHAEAVAALNVMHARREGASAAAARSAAALAEAEALEADAELQEVAHRTEVRCGEEREALREIHAALAAHGARAREDEASQAAAECSRASRHLQSVREQFFETKGRLEQVTAEGRQEAHERAEQGLEDARRKYYSVSRRAAAAAQLHTTLQRHRDRAHRSYAEPYAGEIERLGHHIYGETFGVVVSHDLVITHRRLHGDIVPFESLSGGAKEQLGILARLAVASLVADRQSVPVVVDDALGYTDPQRLHSLGAVIAEGGSQSQLVLLTCTPQRYVNIPGARTIRMTA
ncbi:MAG: AAA family ATPase [Ornithinimicrobium sp.]